MASTDELKRAIDLAISGDWDAAHVVAQSDERDPLHRWLHAILHKMEGDDGNSRYWYRGSGHSHDEFAGPEDELKSLRAALDRAAKS